MKFQLKHELLLSRLRTKDRVVKNITSICKAFALMAAVSSIAIAQRTSSAVQTVTFGVHRSSQSVLNNMPIARSVVHSSDGSEASTLQNVVSTYPMKVTVNALSMPGANNESMTAVQSFLRPSARKRVGSGLVPSRSNIRFDAGSSCDASALVLTITE